MHWSLPRQKLKLDLQLFSIVEAMNGTVPHVPSPLSRIAVRSFGRLHFGLMEISEGQPSCYGGIGLMIDDAVTILRVSASPGRSAIETSSRIISADDYWKPRIQSQLAAWEKMRSHPTIASLALDQAPIPHCGLGSGTQVACTVAASLLASEYLSGPNGLRTQKVVAEMGLAQLIQNEIDCTGATDSVCPRELIAQLSHRGKRSNIGLCGFLEGGFIYDRGRTSPTSETAPVHRTMRVSFPDDWPIILICSNAFSGDSGAAESSMFEQCSTQPNPNRDRMLELVESELLTALANHDWPTFSQCIGRYGRMAGQVFETAQGGLYRTPAIASTVEAANSLGLSSATQSSWGPTVCAVAQDPAHSRWCVERLRTMLPHAAIRSVHAANVPAQVEWS
ncbi:MAG: hypothetical protein ABL921_20845 [Pirellula sp.]